MRAAVRSNGLHASIADSDLLPEQGNFLVGPVEPRLEPDAGNGTIDCPATGMGQCELSQRDCVKDARPDATWPAFGKRNSIHSRGNG